MDKASRTYKSLRNTVVALVYYAINLVVVFFSRQIFMTHLGPEVLGLNTTATSLLQFINLAELGIGIAIGVTLYKPLAENDQEAVNEIVSLQGWFYRKVAWVVIAASCVLMCFFPAIFAKADLPLWYAYASFSVMLFSSMISYFVTYKQIVLSANQQQYLITISYTTCVIIKVIAQMVAVSVFSNGYLWWLILEFLFAIIGNFALNLQIKKHCPELRTTLEKGPELREKYPDVISKIKQLFVHKIGGVVLSQTSPIVISALISLTMVTKYSNYALITTYLIALLSALFNGMGASVGNLVAEGDNARINKVFRELFSSRFLLIAPVSYCYYKLASPFITLWLGDEFVLNNLVILEITLLFFIQATRVTVDSFINAYGIFSDIWAPAAEASINIIFSVILGMLWGLPGILAGVLLSQIIIIFIWKPILLYSAGFKVSIKPYLSMYLKHLFAFAISVFASECLSSQLGLCPSNNAVSFVVSGIVVLLISLVVLGILLYLVERGMRDFTKRIIDLLPAR